jgi:hypothetical protein
VRFPWDASRRAFADAAGWFVGTAALVGDRWRDPGLGEWDVRALVGHTSRSLLTVESYLAQPAATVDVASPGDYYAVTSAMGSLSGVAARGVAAGEALGDDPAGGVAAIASRVVPLVERTDSGALLTTLVGGMRLEDYLPTRTFELAVHTCDLAAALGLPLEVPDTAAAQALRVVAELAVRRGQAGPLLLAATGRAGLPAGWSVL